VAKCVENAVQMEQNKGLGRDLVMRYVRQRREMQRSNRGLSIAECIRGYPCSVRNRCREPRKDCILVEYFYAGRK